MAGVDSCRDLNELHPKLKQLAEKLVEECKKQNISVIITETYRTVERQNYLYAQGRTRAGNIVTNAKGSDMNSYHQWRLAFDVCINIRGKEYDAASLAKIGKIGQSIGLEWGGGWSGFSDAPHFQYTFGLSLSDLKAGKKPPTSQPVVQQTVKAVSEIAPQQKAYSVTVKQIDLKVNGKIRKVDVVNIEGTNFIKLRGISDEVIKVDFVDGMPTIDIR